MEQEYSVNLIEIIGQKEIEIIILKKQLSDASKMIGMMEKKPAEVEDDMKRSNDKDSATTDR
jgi:hypothetical protein